MGHVTIKVAFLPESKWWVDFYLLKVNRYIAWTISLVYYFFSISFCLIPVTFILANEWIFIHSWFVISRATLSTFTDSLLPKIPLAMRIVPLRVLIDWKPCPVWVFIMLLIWKDKHLCFPMLLKTQMFHFWIIKLSSF